MRCDGRLDRDCVLSCVPHEMAVNRLSVSERPEMEETTDAPPHFGQAMGLEDEKTDDEQAKDDRAHG